MPSASSAAAIFPAMTASSASAISSDVNNPLTQAFPKQWCPSTNTWIPRLQTSASSNMSDQEWSFAENRWIPRQSTQSNPAPPLASPTDSTQRAISIDYKIMIQRVLQATIGTRIHIPFHAQRRTGSIIEKLINAVVDSPKCLRHHFRFLAFFKFVLCTPKSLNKGLKKNQNSQTSSS